MALTRSRPHLALAAGIVLMLAPRGATQGTPLPGILHARYPDPTSHWAESLHPAADLSASGRIVFDTLAQTVEVLWYFSVDDTHGNRLDSQSVSFQPTAVARKAGQSPTFYVAGYAPRTGQVVIEEWTVDDAVLAATVTPTGETVPTFSYTWRKQTLHQSTVMGPVRAMAFHPSGDRLVMIEHTPLDDVSALYIATGTHVPLFNRDVYPQLEYAYSAEVIVTSLRGYLLILDPKPHYLIENPLLTSWPDTSMLLQDSDRDGTFDVIDQDFSTQEFNDEGYMEGVDVFYPEQP